MPRSEKLLGAHLGMSASDFLSTASSRILSAGVPDTDSNISLCISARAASYRRFFAYDHYHPQRNASHLETLSLIILPSRLSYRDCKGI